MTKRVEIVIAEEVDRVMFGNHMPTQLKLDVIASLAVLHLEICPDPQSALEAFKKDVTQRLAVALSMKEVK
jgi:hypothetical protein